MTRKVYGDDGDNLINGDGKINSLYGQGGDDTLNGLGGDDRLYGQGGNDRLDGGDGNDQLYAQAKIGGDLGHNTLLGGLGNDSLFAGLNDSADGGAGNDVVNGVGGGTGVYAGGDGLDRLVLLFAPGAAYHGDFALLADEAAGATVTLDGITISGFEGGALLLGAGDDTVKLAKDVSGWSVSGGDGRDVIAGNAHADTLQGGLGDDTVRGLGGDDQLAADAGDHDLVEGGGGNDQLSAYGATATLDGGAGADTIRGGFHTDTLLGGSGDDQLATFLFADAPSLLDGGKGSDTIQVGFGGDTLQGGAGHDIYQFRTFVPSGTVRSTEHISDSDGDFVVDLSAFVADPNHPDDPFTVVDAFDGGPGELVIRYDASDGLTHVEGDLNKDKQADFAILIGGDHTDLSQYVL